MTECQPKQTALLTRFSRIGRRFRQFWISEKEMWISETEIARVSQEMWISETEIARVKVGDADLRNGDREGEGGRCASPERSSQLPRSAGILPTSRRGRLEAAAPAAWEATAP